MKKALSFIIGLVTIIAIIISLSLVSSAESSMYNNIASELKDRAYCFRGQNIAEGEGFPIDDVQWYLSLSWREIFDEEKYYSHSEYDASCYDYIDYYKFPAEVLENEAKKRFYLTEELNSYSGYFKYDAENDLYVRAEYREGGGGGSAERFYFAGYRTINNKNEAYVYLCIDSGASNIEEGDIEGVDYIIDPYGEPAELFGIQKAIFTYEDGIVKLFSWESVDSIPNDLITGEKTGWQNENGKWAYYENGVKVTNKWLQDSKGWCFVGDDGYCVTNDWKADSQGWCYLDDNGRMVINNWVLDVGKWYFMDENGYMVSNQWRKDSKGWCYLSSSGAMSTNAWVKDSAGWCYVGADGYCIVNKWTKDSVGWCYLDANGRMVTDRWIADSKGWCYVGSNGYMVTNKWVKDSVGWCYIGADGYCVTSTWKADSHGWCYLDANGRMVINNWVQDGGKWYYLDANGYMVTGTKVINGKTYKFNSSGVWIA